MIEDIISLQVYYLRFESKRDICVGIEDLKSPVPLIKIPKRLCRLWLKCQEIKIIVAVSWVMWNVGSFISHRAKCSCGAFWLIGFVERSLEKRKIYVQSLKECLLIRGWLQGGAEKLRMQSLSKERRDLLYLWCRQGCLTRFTDSCASAI